MTEKFETIQDRKLEAKRLYIIKGLTAKSVSKLVSVSEKSIGKWIKADSWKEKRDQLINERLDQEFDPKTAKFKIVSSFIAYIKPLFPELSGKLDKVFNDYLKL